MDLSILNQDNSDIVAAEFNEGTSQFVDDLSHVTGKAAKSRNRAIGTIITEDFPNLKLTYRAQYSPYVNYGIAKRGVGTHIGAKSFVSRSQLRDTIIHEELHHRWWKKGIINHHPQRSSKEKPFYQIIADTNGCGVGKRSHVENHV